MAKASDKKHRYIECERCNGHGFIAGETCSDCSGYGKLTDVEWARQFLGTEGGNDD